MILRLTASVFAALVLSVAAVASPIEFCSGSSVVGYAGGNTWTNGGIQLTTAPGTPQCKVKNYSDPVSGTVSGLGVSGGRTNDEIDFEEFVTLDFGGPVTIEQFEIVVFYNGTEFDDPREKGFVDVWFASAAGPETFYFWADAQPATTTLTTNMPGILNPGDYINLSPMTNNGAGWFQFFNPFGDRAITQLRFTAEDNPNLNQSGNVLNNSDYALKSITSLPANVEAIPEPTTYALMGLGLLAMSLFRKRRLA